MPGKRNQVWRRGNHEQKKQPGHDGEVNPLPDRRANPFRTSRAGVLRNESRDIAGRDLQEPERQPVPHDGRERRGHLPLVVPGKQNRVHEHLHRHEALADDQRQSERQQLPAPTVPQGQRAARDLGLINPAAGLPANILGDRALSHLVTILPAARQTKPDNTPRGDTH